MTDTGIRSFEAAEDAELQRKHLIALLPAYVEQRRQRDQHKHKVEHIGNLLKSWLEAHPEEELWDGENRIVARLQERRGAPELDAANLPDELLRWLADHGCLRLDAKLFERLEGKFAEWHEVKQRLMPGKGTTALDVKEVPNG